MILRNAAKAVLFSLLCLAALFSLDRVAAKQVPRQPIRPLSVSDVSGVAKRIQTRFLELRKDAGFPGANVGIVWGNDKAMSVSVGFADLSSHSTPASPGWSFTGPAAKLNRRSRLPAVRNSTAAARAQITPSWGKVSPSVFRTRLKY